MPRPIAHWWVASSPEHPAAVAGLRNARCDGVVRRLYVREQHPETGRLGWVGIGYVCDSCGESGFDPSWRERVEEGWRGRTDDEVFWRLRREREALSES